MAHVPAHNRSFATQFARFNKTRCIRNSNHIEVACKFALPGNIAERSIRVLCYYCNLLSITMLVNAIIGNHLNAFYDRNILGNGRSACCDPALYNLVIVRIWDQSFATAMRHLTRSFLNNQTHLGVRGENPSAPCFVHNTFEIKICIEAKQRKLESILPTRLTMATACITSKLA